MKFLPLVFRNALRNRTRSLLTFTGAGFLVFVLLFMLTALTEFQAWEQISSPNRVAVQHSTSIATPLPYALETYLKGDEIQRHATDVCKLNWFQGVYIDPMNFFARFAIDHEVALKLYPEYELPEAQRKAWFETKNGCILGKRLADRYGLKVGSRVPIRGDIYPVDLELEVVGIYTCPELRLEEQLYFRWDYFDDLLENQKIVGMYWMNARTADDVPKLKGLIDGHTKNSSDPTETMNEKEFNAQFASMMGNFKLLIMFMAVIVLIIMTLMTANTMAMSARERVTEIAVLRTLGFRRTHILSMILGEALVVTGVGGLIAIGGFLALFNGLKLSPIPSFFPVFMAQPWVVGAAIGGALVAGLLAALVPAIGAINRRIVDGLRQVV